MEQWKGFTNGVWNQEVNVRDFILKNLLHIQEMKLS